MDMEMDKWGEALARMGNPKKFIVKVELFRSRFDVDPEGRE
jgi:hypothetical protein